MERTGDTTNVGEKLAGANEPSIGANSGGSMSVIVFSEDFEDDTELLEIEQSAEDGLKIYTKIMSWICLFLNLPFGLLAFIPYMRHDRRGYIYSLILSHLGIVFSIILLILVLYFHKHKL